MKPRSPKAFIGFLPTQDLTGTTQFYAQTLGLPLVLDQGGCRIFAVAGQGYLGFCDREDMLGPEKVVLTLVVEDVEDWHQWLTSQGASTDGPTRINERYGIEHFYVRDPNGYRVEFQRFLDPNWDGCLAGLQVP